MAALAWSAPFNLRGIAGKDGSMVRYGNGAPTSSNPSVQNDGDSYIDLTTGRLYAVRNSGVWPTTYANLACKDGATIRSGTGAPVAGTVANDGDYYFQTDSPTFYGPRSNGTWPSSGTYLQGTAGLGILSGVGAPSSSLGVIGQPGYLDTQSSVLYGTKTSSGWPTGQSLVGARGADGNTIRSGTAEPGLEYGSNGDLYIRQITGLPLYLKVTGIIAETNASMPNGWKNLGNLVGSKGDQGLQGNVGPSGATIRSGSGAPTSSTTANDGDYYFRTDVPTFYGPRTSGSWSSSGTLLKGDQGTAGTNGTNGTNGLSVLSGSGAPSSSLGVVGQPAYYDTTNFIFYGAKTASGWPATGQSILGLNVLTGSGAPDNSLGVVGQPGYIDLTNFIIYGAKTSSGWPTGASFKGATGPQSPGLRSGSGAPTSSNPSYQVDGDYYLRTDVSPFTLYGPRSNGTWPTTFQNTGGSQTQTGNGPPSSAIGAQGDVYYDLLNGFFYPPKQSGGWTLPPINMQGATGPQGYTALSTQAASVGSATYVSATVSATATTLTNNTVPYVFIPFQSSAFMGWTVSNKGVAITLSLVDVAAGTTVASFSVAANTDSYANYTLTQYPLTAGRTYGWTVTGSGTATFQLTPVWLMPAASNANAISTVQGFNTAASTTFSTTAVYPGPFGRNGTSSTCRSYQPIKSAALYGVSGAVYVPSTVGAATATATVSLLYYNYSAGTTSTLATFTLTNNGTPQNIVFSQPIPVSQAGTIFASITGSGTGAISFDLALLM